MLTEPVLVLIAQFGSQNCAAGKKNRIVERRDEHTIALLSTSIIFLCRLGFCFLNSLDSPDMEAPGIQRNPWNPYMRTTLCAPV